MAFLRLTLSCGKIYLPRQTLLWKMTGIDKIADALKELLRDKEIIARCELLLRTYNMVMAANLSDLESLELQKLVGERIAPGIFASIMNGECIFFDLPKLDSYTQMNGHIFHFLHTKRYNKQDFDGANRKFLQSLPELKIILRRALVETLSVVMSDAGYSLSKEGLQYLVFSAEERRLQAFVFTSVKSIDVDECRSEPGVDRVVLVPSGESLDPFVQFFREKGQMAEDAGIQVWVASLEQGTIDPFIGYTTDMNIYRQFKNPRLAEMVRANWSIRK
ncbi:Uncharacterised protein [uncultured archaeon]|nr:Uncharacterised protein [uncultured archaeon]